MKLEIMMTDKGQVAVYRAAEVNVEIGKLQKKLDGHEKLIKAIKTIDNIAQAAEIIKQALKQ